MMGIFKPLYIVFGFCMAFFMSVLGDQYFLAITLFVIATRLVLIPFNMKQQKTTAKTSRIQPKISKIQKKYANTGNLTQKQVADNRTKMNEEMQALYARENHNPMNMGCGPMIFQMIFLFGIIGIIYQPLTYVLRLDVNVVKQLTDAATAMGSVGTSASYAELAVFSHFDALRQSLADTIKPEVFTQIAGYRSGMIIGSFDLTQMPTFKDISIIVPILSFGTSMLSTIYSMRVQKKNNPGMADQNKMMNITMLLMPLMSLYIAFKVPGAVGIYWAISNLVSMIQQMVLNKTYSPKKVVAKSMIDSTVERRSHEAHIRSMAKG